MWLVKQFTRRSRRSDWRGYFLIGCVVMLALMLAGTSWSAWRSSQERKAARNWQIHTLQVLLETDRLRTATLQMMRGERGYLLTNDDTFLVPYRNGLKSRDDSFARLAQLTAGSPAQQVRVGRMENEYAHYDATIAEMIDDQSEGRHDRAVANVRKGDDRAAIEVILRELEGVETFERRLLAERSALANRRAAVNEYYQYLLAGLGLLMLTLASLATIYVRRAIDAEAEARRELQRFASTDALTGLPNRRSFIEALERSVARAENDPARKLSLAIFDIDHFKRINDRFGHPAGDDVIREVAVRSLDSLRKRDLVGRIGGEEFAVILPGADINTAADACERLRAALAAKPMRHKDSIIPFTASIGIAEFSPGDDLDHLMTRADAALYDAKTGGRDRIGLAA